MSYDASLTARLIRQTDNAGALATTAEIERSNQLQRAADEIVRLSCLNAHRDSLNAEAWQTIEDVAIGTKLHCPRCRQWQPCLCDK